MAGEGERTPQQSLDERLAALARPIPEQFGFDTYLSAFTFKYGSTEMRRNWSQQQFWLNCRDVQIAAARVQNSVGKVTNEELADLERARNDINVARILNLEQVLVHDVVAANTHYREVAPIGGRVLGNGFTSEDTLSNAEIMQIRDGFGILRPRLVGNLAALAGQIERHHDTACMGYTHLQAAEPTTMGYRFARYAANLVRGLHGIDQALPGIEGKGLKGPVGTGASFENVLRGTGMSPEEHEEKVMAMLGLPFVLVSDQTYPRSFLFDTMKTLAGIGLSLHNASMDIQILQSSNFDEVSEPRNRLQPGSNAMPHKQNPNTSENVASLAELQPGHLTTAWITGAFQTLERTLRDSANKRSWLPEAFLAVDEMLIRGERVFKGLRVHENAVATNLRKHGPFAASEIILGNLVDAGADRIAAHEWLMEHSETAKEALREGQSNPFETIVLLDERITGLLGLDGVTKAFAEVYQHTGTASRSCRKFLDEALYPAITS